jgi:hypothetical protein
MSPPSRGSFGDAFSDTSLRTNPRMPMLDELSALLAAVA